MDNKWWFAGIMDDGTFIVEPVKDEIDHRVTFGVDGRVPKMPSIWITFPYEFQPSRLTFTEKFEELSGFTLPSYIKR